MFDLRNEWHSGATLAPRTVTTNSEATGTAVDLSNGNLVSTAELAVGAISGTSPSLTMRMQSSATTNSADFVDIPNAVFETVTNSSPAALLYQKILFQVPANHRYVRCVGTVSGTSPSFAAAVIVHTSKRYVAEAGKNSGASRSPSN